MRIMRRIRRRIQVLRTSRRAARGFAVRGHVVCYWKEEGGRRDGRRDGRRGAEHNGQTARGVRRFLLKLGVFS